MTIPLKRKLKKVKDGAKNTAFSSALGKGIPAAVNYVVHDYCDRNDWLLVMQQDIRFLDRRLFQS